MREMFMSIRRGCASVLCFVIFAVAVTGCFLTGKNPLSSDSVFEKCAEYDAEEYESLDDIKAELENDRALLAGMYIKLEGENIKKGLTNDKIGDVLADAQEEILQHMYSKMIIQATMLIQAETAKDGGVCKMVAVAADFEDDQNASKYYKAFIRYLGETYDESSKDNDDEYSIYTVKEFKGQRAFSERVYMKANHVLIVAGYEYKNNSVTDRMKSFCGLVGVEAPDISSYDCTSKENMDRIGELAAFYNAGELKKRDFEKKLSQDGAMCDYATLPHPEMIISQMTGFAFDDKTVTSCRCLINREEKDDVMCGFGVFEIQSDSVPNSVLLYDSFCEYVKTSFPDADRTSEDSKDGMRFFFSEISTRDSAQEFAVYSDNDKVYIISIFAKDNLSVSGYHYDVINAMELPM